MHCQAIERISAKVDVLLREAFETQISIERLTANKSNVWGIAGATTLNLESFAEKERIFDTRYRRDNAYYKLNNYPLSILYYEKALKLDPNNEEIIEARAEFGRLQDEFKAEIADEAETRETEDARLDNEMVKTQQKTEQKNEPKNNNESESGDNDGK